MMISSNIYTYYIMAVDGIQGRVSEWLGVSMDDNNDFIMQYITDKSLYRAYVCVCVAMDVYLINSRHN